MFSQPQYTTPELQQYDYFVMQEPVLEEKIEEPVFMCAYEENGVLYCASSTSQEDYYYTYVLNNPLTFTDPSGYFMDQPGRRKRPPKMYITQGANFGWDTYPSDPWLQPYQVKNYGGGPRSFSDTHTYLEGSNGSAGVKNSDMPILTNGVFIIYESGTSLDFGETFTGYGHYCIILAGIMKSDGVFPSFYLRSNADDFVLGLENPPTLTNLFNQLSNNDIFRLGLRIATKRSDAYSIDINGEASAVVASAASPAGIIIKTKGLEAGKIAVYAYGEMGGGTVHANAQVSITNYYILGTSPDKVTLGDFQGIYTKGFFSGDALISAGASFILSNPNPGVFILGISKSAGVGISLTPVSGGISTGWMYFYLAKRDEKQNKNQKISYCSYSLFLF